MNEKCDKGEKGVAGATSHTFFEINKGGWTEKHIELQNLCFRIQKFLKENIEIASVVKITKDTIESRLG